MGAPYRSATVGFEVHHRGFRITIRGRAGHQIVHEYGQTEREVADLLRAHHVDPRNVDVLSAQS